MTTEGNDKRRLLKAILKNDGDQVRHILDGIKAPDKVRTIYIGFTEEEEAELRRREELEPEIPGGNELPGQIHIKYRDDKPEHGGCHIRYINPDGSIEYEE